MNIMYITICIPVIDGGVPPWQDENRLSGDDPTIWVFKRDPIAHTTFCSIPFNDAACTT